MPRQVAFELGRQDRTIRPFSEDSMCRGSKSRNTEMVECVESSRRQGPGPGEPRIPSQRAWASSHVLCSAGPCKHLKKGTGKSDLHGWSGCLRRGWRELAGFGAQLYFTEEGQAQVRSRRGVSGRA